MEKEKLIRIAIADDHEMFRKGVMEIISSFGGFVIEIEAPGGKELFEKISKAATLPDIVIIDISMPHGDGYETLGAMKRKFPELKVLVLTMHKHEFAVIRMYRDGASGYMLKNSDPKELKKALMSIYETGSYISGLAANHFIHTIRKRNPLPALTEIEIQILKLCCTDMTYQEIAEHTKHTDRSVAGLRDNLFAKLGVNNRSGLVMCAIKMGLVSVED